MWAAVACRVLIHVRAMKLGSHVLRALPDRQLFLPASVRRQYAYHSPECRRPPEEFALHSNFYILGADAATPCSVRYFQFLSLLYGAYVFQALGFFRSHILPSEYGIPRHLRELAKATITRKKLEVGLAVAPHVSSSHPF